MTGMVTVTIKPYESWVELATGWLNRRKFFESCTGCWSEAMPALKLVIQCGKSLWNVLWYYKTRDNLISQENIESRPVLTCWQCFSNISLSVEGPKGTRTTCHVFPLTWCNRRSVSCTRLAPRFQWSRPRSYAPDTYFFFAFWGPYRHKLPGHEMRLSWGEGSPPSKTRHPKSLHSQE